MRALLACALFLGAAPLRAELLPEEQNTIRVFKEAAPSVVFVTNIAVERDMFMDELAVPQGAGSGFIWDKEGHVVTNFHVVNGGDRFLVTLDGQTQLEARVVGVDPRKDVAVLKIKAPQAKLEPIRLGSSDSLQVGQQALAIGNPFGLDNTLTTGIVSALGRQVQGIGGVTIHDMIQTDAAINPGNSGGPLIDSSGQLIGMNTMIYSQSGGSAGIGFAVPVAYIKRIVPQLIKYGRVIEPGIGVVVLPDRLAYQILGGALGGVVVRQVEQGTPAARAGMRGLMQDPETGRLILGDVIVGIDGTPVTDFDDLYNALDDHRVGDTVTVHTLRNGRKRSYRVQLVNVD